MSGPLFVLTVVAALGSAAVGGVFLAFSTFVMKGLGRLPAEQGTAAMRSINVTAVTAPFMLALFGTGLLCLGLGVHAVVAWHGARSAWILAGALTYVIGVIVVTAGYHVPRNDALAAVDPDSEAGRSLWGRYLVEWTRGNHVRTLAGLASAACLVIALTR